MKIKIVPFLFIITSILFFSSCKDKYDEDRSNHTLFRCDVNGVDWTHNHSAGGFLEMASFASLEVKYENESGAFDLIARYRPEEFSHLSRRDQNFEFNIEEGLRIDENDLNELQDHNERIYYKKDEDLVNGFDVQAYHYYLDSTTNNKFIIDQIDSTNHILRGTFYFEAATKDGEKRIKVRNGEFDMYYYDR